MLHGMKLVTSPSSESERSKFSGRSNKTSTVWILSQVITVVKRYHDIVLPWLAATGTLRKEFETNKLGNIRLRAFPVED